MNNDKLKATPPASIDMADLGFERPRACDDAYYTRGSDFPVPAENTDNGKELGTEGLTGGQSDKQLSPRLNASKPGEANSTWAHEGRQFPASNNGVESENESQTFAGNRDASVAVSLVSGQVVSSNESRLVPVPEDRNDNKTRALMKFRKTKADAKENRL